MKVYSILFLVLVIGSELVQSWNDHGRVPLPKYKGNKTKPSKRRTAVPQTSLADEWNTDNSILTTELSTETTEVTSQDDVIDEVTISTPSNPSTSQPSACSGSEISKADLKDLIHHVAQEMKLFESVREYYYDNAIEIRNKHEKILNIFLTWFKERPEHLKHILKDMSHSQERIQLAISKINAHLTETAGLSEAFNETVRKANITESDIKKIGLLCEISCRPQLSNYVQYEGALGQATENYYCGNLGDVYTKVRDSMIEFTENIKEQLKNKLEDDDKLYHDKVKELENNLKDLALKEFGRTMYDILNIIDYYHHLEENVNFESIRNMTQHIKSININASQKIMYLKDNTEKLKEKCSKCTSFIMIRSRFEEITVNVNQAPTLLEVLMEEYKTEMKDKVIIEYNEVFKTLKEELIMLNEDDMNQHIDNLKSIQEEVAAMTTAEMNTFLILQGSFPRATIEELTIAERDGDLLLHELEIIEKDLKDLNDRYSNVNP